MELNVKELAKWLKEEVEFLTENEEYVGGWNELDNGLGLCMYWSDGYGKESREDVIQSKENPDYALVVAIKVIEPEDISGGGPYYWNLPSYENGEVATEEISITPTEDYEKLAEDMLAEFKKLENVKMTDDGVIVKEKEVVEESTSLSEDSEKPLTKSPYKSDIGEYFEYSADFEFLDVVASILGRIDDLHDEDEIWKAIDDELIYTVDKWTVMEHYQNPEDANFMEAMTMLQNDIFSLVHKIVEKEEE